MFVRLAFATAIQDPIDVVRARAVITLGKIGDSSVVPKLLNVLEDPDLMIRINAVRALTRIGVTDAVLELLKLDFDQSLKISDYRAKTLQEIGNPIVLSQLWQLCLAGPPYPLFAIYAIQNRCQFYNYTIWQEAVAIQKANKEQPATTTQQMTNIFPNAAEVKIFERVEHFHQAATLPPDSSS
jgi:hypothetical protein